jgi:hypothetical protein
MALQPHFSFLDLPAELRIIVYEILSHRDLLFEVVNILSLVSSLDGFFSGTLVFLHF